MGKPAKLSVMSIHSVCPYLLGRGRQRALLYQGVPYHRMVEWLISRGCGSTTPRLTELHDSPFRG